MKKYLLLIILAPVIVFGQVSPDNAVQGQSLSVQISGTYSDFNFYSDQTRFRLVNTNDGSEIISNWVWAWDDFSWSNNFNGLRIFNQ